MFLGVAVEEFNLSYHNRETMIYTKYRVSESFKSGIRIKSLNKQVLGILVLDMLQKRHVLTQSSFPACWPLRSLDLKPRNPKARVMF